MADKVTCKECGALFAPVLAYVKVNTAYYHVGCYTFVVKRSLEEAEAEAKKAAKAAEEAVKQEIKAAQEAALRDAKCLRCSAPIGNASQRAPDWQDPASQERRPSKMCRKCWASATPGDSQMKASAASLGNALDVISKPAPKAAPAAPPPKTEAPKTEGDKDRFALIEMD